MVAAFDAVVCLCQGGFGLLGGGDDDALPVLPLGDLQYVAATQADFLGVPVVRPKVTRPARCRRTKSSQSTV